MPRDMPETILACRSPMCYYDSAGVDKRGAKCLSNNIARESRNAGSYLLTEETLDSRSTGSGTPRISPSHTSDWRTKP